MAVRVARSRAAALVVLLAIALGALAAITYVTATTSSAITPPTDPDPVYEGEPLALDALPESVTTATMSITGVADALDDVTIELISPSDVSSFCAVSADGAGVFGCTMGFTESGEYEVQAYRFGGLFVEHFDSTEVVFVGGASLDDAPGPVYWNNSYSLALGGTVWDGSYVDFVFDGDVVGGVDSEGAWGSGIFSCSAASPTFECSIMWGENGLAEGSHTVSVVPWVVVGGEEYYEGQGSSLEVILDSETPSMATIEWPSVATPEFRAVSDPLPRVSVTYPFPWFDGTGEPGSTVYVVYHDGDDRNSQLWEYAWPVCDAVVEPDGWWGCGSDSTVPAGTTWTVGTWQQDQAGNSTWWSDSSAQLFVDYVEGPVTPVITAPSNGATIVGQTVTVSGTGAVGDDIALFQELSEEHVNYYCGGEGWTIGVYSGQWSCTIHDLAYGEYTLTAAGLTDDGEGYIWGGTDEVTFTLVSPPVPPGATPTSGNAPRPAPEPWSFQLTDADGNPINAADLRPGDRFFVYAEGLPPGATVTVELHSTPVSLGAATVDSLGNLRMPIAIPEDVEPGEHNIVATLTPVDGEPSTVSTPVIVAGAVAAPDDTVGGAPEPEPAAEPPPATTDLEPAGSAGADAAQPSTFSSTLQTVSEVRLTPSTVATAAVLAFALIVFVSLPAELLQSTIGANYARAFGWLTPLRERGRRFRDRIPSWVTDGRVGGAITVAVTALILGFADPTFTWDAPSFRLWAAIFASLFVVNVVVLSIVRSVARRRYAASSWLDPMPAAIIVVALSVLVSRLAHIEPGFLFGLVVGVMFARELRKAEDGKLAVLATALLIAFGIGAWLLFSLLPAEGGVALQFTRDLLSATTLEAISTLVVALLPLAFLEGRTIFAWSKAAWVATYAVAVTAFVIIVVPMSDSWGDVSAPLFGWVTLFAVFGVVAIAIWALFRFIPEKNREAVSLSSRRSSSRD